MVLLVAVAALVLYAEVMWRRSVTKLPSALRIARLMHSGDWNVVPDSCYLMAALRGAPHEYDARVTKKELFARDPHLIYCPLVYLTGRGPFDLSAEDLRALRNHLAPGGGTLFADAACGNAEFDSCFRRLVGELLPDRKLEPIPRDDELFTDITSFDLSQCRYTKAAGGKRDYPDLEGVKIDGYWAIIYSKYGVGCVLERPHDEGCKGYARNDAARIWWSVFIRPVLP
jgi:hypothetical protein